MDEIDKTILNELQKDCRVSLKELAKIIPLKPSAIHYRIKNLEEKGIIEGYHAKINPTKIEEDFRSIVLIQVRYGPDYLEDIGKKLADIEGVKAVYYVLGENDFIVTIRSSDKKKFMDILRKIREEVDIERSNSIVIANIIKEDNRILFKSQ